VFAPRLIALCAEAGVVVAFVPALPKLPVCGATRWLSSTKAMMLLTLRYKTDDHLWFTVFHEAAHILLHGKRAVFVEEARPSAPSRALSDAESHERAVAEEEANRFARDLLIPPGAYAAFRRRGEYSAEAIRAFAQEIDIAPGVVLGRLQHDHVIPYPTPLNTMLKARFELVSHTEAI
jgi:HTH-type transcriptional regulator/antitoxin HigA